MRGKWGVKYNAEKEDKTRMKKKVKKKMKKGDTGVASCIIFFAYHSAVTFGIQSGLYGKT